MIFQLFVLKHLTKTLCLFFLCFRPCSMPKHTLMPPVCSKRIHRRIHFIWCSNVFSEKILINCVSLFLMLFSMFRSESLAIACSDMEASWGNEDWSVAHEIETHFGGGLVSSSWEGLIFLTLFLPFAVPHSTCMY